MKLTTALLFAALSISAYGQTTEVGSVSTTAPNDATTGTVLYGTAILTSEGGVTTAIAATTANTVARVGIIGSGAGTTGRAAIAWGGIVPCIFDSSQSSTQNFYVVQSSTQNHECSATLTPSAGSWVIGFLYDTATNAGQTSRVLIDGFTFGGTGGGATYPAAGVARSNGTGWLTPYQVGLAASDLVQLTVLGLLPYQLLPAISSYQQAGTTPCDQILAAANISIAGGFGQDIILDFPQTDLACPTSPIPTAFAGNIQMNGGHTFHMYNGASWIVPPKTQLTGAGSGAPGVGVFTLMACNAADTANSANCGGVSQAPMTPLLCFVSCSTSATAQGYGSLIQHMTLDGNGVPGVIGVMNLYCQENCGGDDLDVRGWDNNGRGIWCGTSTGQGSCGNSKWTRLNLTNSVAQTWRVCQEGAVGIYNDTLAGGPKGFSAITIGNTYCNALNTANGWAAWPLENMDVVTATTKIDEKVHGETFEKGVVLQGGKRTGFGAYYQALTAGGNITGTVQVSTGKNYVAPTVNVYPTTCTGGTITPNLGTGGIISSLTLSGTWTGCPASAAVLLSIYDSVTASGSTSVVLQGAEGCCVNAIYSATASVIEIANSGLAEKSLKIQGATCGAPNPPAFLITDPNHLSVSCSAAHNNIEEYSTDALAGIFLDSSYVNPSAFMPNILPSGFAGVYQTLCAIPAGPTQTFCPPGLQSTTTTSGAFTIQAGDVGTFRAFTNASTASVAIPNPTVIGASFSMALGAEGAGNLTLTPGTSPVSYTISAGSGGTPASTLTLLSGQICAPLRLDATVANGHNWVCEVKEQAANVSGFLTLTRNVSGFTIGMVNPIYSTPSASVAANIAVTPMITNAAAVHGYRLGWYIDQTVAGIACTGNTTFTLNEVFTDPNNSGATTAPVASSITVVNNGAVGTTLSRGTSGLTISKASAQIGYSISGYAAGSGCSTNPSFQVYPTLEQVY